MRIHHGLPAANNAHQGFLDELPSKIRQISRYCNHPSRKWLPTAPPVADLPRSTCKAHPGTPRRTPSQPAPASYRGHPKSLLQSLASERWMSGLSRTPGKRVWANPHRGFESRPLRHTLRKTGPYTGPVFVSGPACGKVRAQVCTRCTHRLPRPRAPAAHQGKRQHGHPLQALRRPAPGLAIGSSWQQ